MLKKIALILVIFLIVIQFFRPAKNESNDNTYHINTKYATPQQVENILVAACYDCHSNTTRYPWYFQLQPVAWFLSQHVNEGKEHLNFSEFTNLPVAAQFHKLEETIEMVESKEMAMAAYTALGLHKEAALTDAQRKVIIDWVMDIRNQIKETYPADSLVRKRKK